MQYVDRYLARSEEEVVPSELQLLMVTGLFMSSKMLEITFLDMEYCALELCQGQFHSLEILNLESKIVELNDWNLNQMT